MREEIIHRTFQGFEVIQEGSRFWVSGPRSASGPDYRCSRDTAEEAIAIAERLDAALGSYLKNRKQIDAERLAAADEFDGD